MKLLPKCPACNKLMFKKSAVVKMKGIDPETNVPYINTIGICKRCYKLFDEQAEER